MAHEIQVAWSKNLVKASVMTQEQDRFKGYIRTNAEAEVILKALQLKPFSQYLG